MNKLLDFNRRLAMWLGLALSLLFKVFLLLGTHSAWSQSNQAELNVGPVKAFIRAQLLPEAGVRGQKRVLQVNIYTRYWFKRVPQMPPLKIADVVVIQPKGFGVNFTESHHGVNYNVQTQEYQLFPQRQGVFVIPALAVDFAVQREQRPEEISLETEPLYLLAKPLAPEQARVLVAENLSLEESYSVEQTHPFDQGQSTGQAAITVLLGQLVDRQIQLRAESSLAMLIDPFAEGSLVRDEGGVAYTVINGGRRYREVLSVKDDNNRGQTIASRKERWRYVFDTPGEFVIPALSVDWFDIGTQSWRQASLPQLRINVISSDGVTRWKLRYLFALLLLPVIYFSRTHVYRLAMGLLEGGRFRLKNSEWYCWQRLNRACRKGRSDEIIRTFYAWRQCYNIILAVRGDTAPDLSFDLGKGLAPEWSALFSRQGTPFGPELLLGLKQYRHRLKLRIKNNQKSDSRICLPDIFKP